jgi:CheY-like chemotaxis protein
VAANGEEAVNAFHPDAYDVVLMDVSMPVMTGLEASKIIREREVAQGWPHRPIIALTGNAFRQDERDARAAGMDGFLTKPIAREPLLSCITEHLSAGTCTEQGTTGAGG